MIAQEWSLIDEEQAEIVHRYMNDLPVKLGALARDLGISVKLSTLKPGISGHIRREGEDLYVIRINRHEARERQRFTLAHEISHYLLHRDVIDKFGEIEDNILYRSGASEQKEYEANRLAADLVMPHKAVQSVLEAMKPLASEEVIDQMAETFQVSKAAMEVRLSTIAG